jgi:hypothetical protein
LSDRKTNERDDPDDHHDDGDHHGNDWTINEESRHLGIPVKLALGLAGH